MKHTLFCQEPDSIEGNSRFLCYLKKKCVCVKEVIIETGWEITNKSDKNNFSEWVTFEKSQWEEAIISKQEKVLHTQSPCTGLRNGITLADLET